MRRCSTALLLMILAGAGFCGCREKTTRQIDPGLDPAAADDLQPLADAPDLQRTRADLELVAKPRPPGSAQWQAVQDLCAERLGALGFTVERQSFGSGADSGTNVIGRLSGQDLPAEEVLISAHYDHLAGCPGADDNGSGLVGALEAARLLARAPHRRTLIVACWDGEESGLRGSSAFAERAKSQGEQILASLVFEMIGFKSDLPSSQQFPFGFALLFPEQAKKLAENQNRGDFILLVSKASSSAQAQAFQALAEQKLALPTVHLVDNGLLGDLMRSDHASFWTAGFPAIMITDTANFRNPNYHCAAAPDRVEDLNLPFALQVIQATASIAAKLLE